VRKREEDGVDTAKLVTKDDVGTYVAAVGEELLLYR
jgi:hypothetical protein